MTVKNTKLGGTDWVINESVYAEDLNDTVDKLINTGGETSIIQSGLNAVRTLIDRTLIYSAGYTDGFGDAYIDADGRNDTVAYTNLVFDSDKYKATTNATEPFIIIEATGLTESDFSINDCLCTEVSSGKWQVSCTVGTDAVKRAQIYKTLFYGSDGTNARVTDTYITTLTALKTNSADDVGKQAHYAKHYHNRSTTTDTDSTGTFANTTTNTNCSVWSNITNNDTNLSGDSWFQMPSGTSLNHIGESDTSDEIGTDKTSDELDNPATITLRDQIWTNGKIGNERCIVLCVGDITWVKTGGDVVLTEIDFFTDESVPLLTATTETFENLITHTIPSGRFPSDTNISICVPFIEDWETGANIQYKLTNATEDSGWFDCMNNKPELNNFTAFTSQPTSIIIKLVPKGTPTANYPSINGFWCYSYTV